MGANVDTNESSFFIIDQPEWTNGAIATGSPGYVQNTLFAPPVETPVQYSNRNTWLVCPHLSQPDFVYQYYLASGLISIVLGKCFCETCLDRILSHGNWSDLINSCRPMTDYIFQEDFINL